jgi:hypothetical protein
MEITAESFFWVAVVFALVFGQAIVCQMAYDWGRRDAFSGLGRRLRRHLWPPWK